MSRLVAMSVFTRRHNVNATHSFHGSLRQFHGHNKNVWILGNGTSALRDILVHPIPFGDFELYGDSAMNDSINLGNENEPWK